MTSPHGVNLNFAHADIVDAEATAWGEVTAALKRGETLPITDGKGNVIGQLTDLTEGGEAKAYFRPGTIPQVDITDLSIMNTEITVAEKPDEKPADEPETEKTEEPKGGKVAKPKGSTWLTE